jgi:hypothetical protein
MGGTVTLRDLMDQLMAIHLTQGDLPVLAEEGLELVSVEYNDDEEPCILLTFEEDFPEIITLADITKREP